MAKSYAIYTGFYFILGEEDRSVETVTHLAKLRATEEELTQWTDITAGDSLPIAGLAEAPMKQRKPDSCRVSWQTRSIGQESMRRISSLPWMAATPSRNGRR